MNLRRLIQIKDTEDNDTLILSYAGEYRKKGVFYSMYFLDSTAEYQANKEREYYWENEHTKTISIREMEGSEGLDWQVKINEIAMDRARKLYPNNTIVWGENYI